jgi:hypothetical protein
VSKIQEDIEQRSIALSIRAAKITEQILAKAMLAVLRKMKEGHDAPKEGKQSIKQLSKGGTLSNIEVTEGNIKNFDPIARKYGISYALQKDSASEPPRWMVFFRAKDVDALTAAFKEYSKKAIKKEADRPSVRDTMRDLREKVASLFKDKIRHKHREGPEL